MTANVEKWPKNVMTTAEKRAFQQICTREGKILVVAMDQRNSMRKLLSNDEKVIASVEQKDLARLDVFSSVRSTMGQNSSHIPRRTPSGFRMSRRSTNKR